MWDSEDSCGCESSLWVSEDKAETSTWEGDADKRCGVSGLEGMKAGFSMPLAPFIVTNCSPDSSASEKQKPRFLSGSSPWTGDSAPVRESVPPLGPPTSGRHSHPTLPQELTAAWSLEHSHQTAG